MCLTEFNFSMHSQDVCFIQLFNPHTSYEMLNASFENVKAGDVLSSVTESDLLERCLTDQYLLCDI